MLRKGAGRNRRQSTSTFSSLLPTIRSTRIGGSRHNIHLQSTRTPWLPSICILCSSLFSGDPGSTETAGIYSRPAGRCQISEKNAEIFDQGGIGRGAPSVRRLHSPLTAWDLRWTRLRRHRLIVAFVYSHLLRLKFRGHVAFSGPKRDSVGAFPH